MGWSVRKSFKVGPVRINLSNSGISSSFGVKGGRISVGKKGTYVNVGSSGIYYRKKISGRSRTRIFWLGVILLIVGVTLLIALAR